MPESLIVIGGGEHAHVVIDAARAQPDRFVIVGIVDPSPSTAFDFGVPWLGDDRTAAAGLTGEARIVLGLGGPPALRQKVAAAWATHSWRWTTVVHPRASVSPSAQLEGGAVVLANAVVNACAHVGAHAIVNSGAIVEHHVVLGPFVHVAPRAVLGGGAKVGAATHVGLGATVRDHVEIGERTVVGMAAAVTRSFAGDVTLIGVPARVRN